MSVFATMGACATIPASAPPYRRAPDAGGGRTNVYVYRSDNGSCQKLGAPTLYVDGRAIYDLLDGAYTVVPLPPGPHPFKILWSNGTCPDLDFHLIVEVGRAQYVKISDEWGPAETPRGPGFEGRVEARQVPEATAEAELRACCRFVAADPLPRSGSAAR